MTANNVIRGPWVGNDPTIVVPPSIATTGVNLIKANHIQDTLIILMPMLFHNIEIAGFHFDEQATDDTLKDGTLIVEAVKSLLFKHYGLYHPLQDVAEAVFVPDAENENHLDFAERLDIDLDPIEPLIIGVYDEDDASDVDALEE